jgi:hypothetical protein
VVEIADDYDRLSINAKGLETQEEHDEKEANRLRQQQATTSLLNTSFSYSAKRAIDLLIRMHERNSAW